MTVITWVIILRPLLSMWPWESPLTLVLTSNLFLS